MQLKIGEDVYPFDLDGLRNDEADALERALGCSYAQFTEKVKGGFTSAITAYVWIMRRRTDPKARISDVKFVLRDMDLLYSDDEARELLAQQDGKEAREQFLASLPEEQRARVEAPAEESAEDESDPLASGEPPAAESAEPTNATAT